MVITMILLEILVCTLLINPAYADVSENFQDCLQFFFNRSPPQFRTNADIKAREAKFKCLCTKYIYQYYFATYYDTNRKVPLYSAYKVDHLKNEIVNVNDNNRSWRRGAGLGNDEQPLITDFDGLGAWGIHRGHLATRSFFPTIDGRKSTDVITNIAPQWQRFNQNTWYSLEKSVLDASQNHCIKYGGESYFITGVVPSNISFRGINMPSHFWTAVCCDTSKTIEKKHRFNGWSFAYMVANENNRRNKVDIFTVKEFLKNEIIRNIYVELFDTIPVNGPGKQFRYVSNCLFNPKKADEVINGIKNKLKDSVEVHRSEEIIYIDSGYYVPEILRWLYKLRNRQWYNDY